jgi:hypothetical protein
MEMTTKSNNCWRRRELPIRLTLHSHPAVLLRVQQAPVQAENHPERVVANLAEKTQLCADTGDYRGFYKPLMAIYGPSHKW